MLSDTPFFLLTNKHSSKWTFYQGRADWRAASKKKDIQDAQHLDFVALKYIITETNIAKMHDKHRKYSAIICDTATI